MGVGGRGLGALVVPHVSNVSHVRLVRAIVYSDLSNDFYASNRSADLLAVDRGRPVEPLLTANNRGLRFKTSAFVPPTASRQQLQTTIDLVELLAIGLYGVSTNCDAIKCNSDYSCG